MILIVKAESTSDVLLFDGKPPEDYLVAIVTLFKVLQPIKGEYKEDKIQIIHFRLKENAAVANGPLLVRFPTRSAENKGDGAAAALDDPNYLVFLKKGKSGSFEFVSGQDARPSVKRLVEPMR